jgi:flagellar FliL protein
MFKKKPETPQTAGQVQTQEAAPAAQGVAEIGELYPFESFIVNLADPGGTRYLRVTLQVELSATKGLKDEMDKRQPQIRDAVLTILSSKRFEEINSAQGKMVMKQQIMRSINSVLTTGQILNVYVTEFVVQ